MSTIPITQDEIKDFWEDEIVSTSVYGYLSRKAKGEKSSLFKEISEMEKTHADFWNGIATELYSKTYKVGIGTRIKRFFMKILALIMPLSFIVYYLEQDERVGIIRYAEVLEKFKHDPNIYPQLEKIITQEIQHETHLIKLLLGEEEHLKRIKDAIYGMTDSLVEILALVIGLAGVFQNQPLLVGLAGLIAAIGGTFSMTSGAYLSAKSQNDIYTGKVKEIEIKGIIGTQFLKEELIEALESHEIKPETAIKIASALEKDPNVMKTLLKQLAIEESPEDAKSSAITTGFYYIIGALPPITPFFVAAIVGSNAVVAAIFAVVLSATVSFLSGLYTAVLSGISVKKTAINNVLIIIGATMATFFIGSLARTFLGIEV